MSLIRKIFGNAQEDPEALKVRFGRYSDAYKADEKYDAWDRALELFDQQDYKASFNQFFEYLTDDEQENVETWEEGDVLHFKLLQGSKVIEGTVSGEIIKAEAKVARAAELNIGFLRRMIEQNFILKYSRYGLDNDDNITLLFDSYLLDGSPYKLYYALKEIAVNADKQDDLLINEFDMLEPINTGHLTEVSDGHKRIKTGLLKERIEATLKEIDEGKLNPDQYAGGIGYLLLDTAYRLDYLVKPEGTIMELFERIHRTYFSSDKKSTIEKNVSIRKEFQKILDRDDQEIGKELYNVSSSFGITSPSTHEQLVNFIDGEIHNMDWYVENKHSAVAMAIPGYIAGYGLFNYAFQPPARELLHLYYHITEPEYFVKLGFQRRFASSDGSLDRRAIKQSLQGVIDRNKDKYPKLQLSVKSLDFASMPAFAKSYFLMIRGLDLTKKA